MSDRMAAHQVANLFRQVFGIIAGALQRLGHEQYVEALDQKSVG